ncbi:hypothetical protein Ae356Ps1_6316 [Pseudonocardia sp. Ae356_Ps1]|nr:hypothetical protein Ae356Ps1_6316 [Pseudonocardia sp. Ae356_Ps1]
MPKLRDPDHTVVTTNDGTESPRPPTGEVFETSTA